MRNYQAKTVDEYIASATPEAQPSLNQLRTLIKATVPTADESISWGVPFYKDHGLLAGFSYFKQHVTFGLAFTLDEVDRQALAAQGYHTGKKTVQIQFDQALPTEIIRRMLLTKLAANQAKR